MSNQGVPNKVMNRVRLHLMVEATRRPKKVTMHQKTRAGPSKSSYLKSNLNSKQHILKRQFVLSENLYIFKYILCSDGSEITSSSFNTGNNKRKIRITLHLHLSFVFTSFGFCFVNIPQSKIKNNS